MLDLAIAMMPPLFEIKDYRLGAVDRFSVDPFRNASLVIRCIAIVNVKTEIVRTFWRHIAHVSAFFHVKTFNRFHT